MREWACIGAVCPLRRIAMALRRGAAACAIVALSALGAAGGEPIVGKPRVVDGDTLDFSGRLIRLFGIDAPQIDQVCRLEGQLWPCGKAAHWAALDRISPHWVTCIAKPDADGGTAGAGPDTAICYLAGEGQIEVNAWLVEQGWALADRAATDDYVAAEETARRAVRGLWRSTFIPPWEWRDGRRLPP